MNRRKSIVLMLVLLANSVVADQETDEADPNFILYADQYARCAVFFAISVEALVRLGDQKTALTYQEYQYGATMYSFGYASEGRDEDEAQELVNSFIERHQEQMLEVMDGRDENVAILIDRHHQDCVDIVQNPP